MNFRIPIAAIAGGVAMFLWGFIAHMVLPLGEAGMQALPHEAKLLPEMGTALNQQAGLYIFPWPESSPGKPMPMGKEAQQAMAELYKTAPHGLLLFNPPGSAMLTGGQLLAEFGTNCASSLIAALLVSSVIGSLRSFTMRVLFVTAIGVSAGIAVNVPYWNWYGFPSVFTLAEILEHALGFLATGLVIAAVIKPPRIEPGAKAQSAPLKPAQAHV